MKKAGKARISTKLLAVVIAGVAIAGPAALVATQSSAGATPTSVMVQAETPRLSPWGGGYDWYWPLHAGTIVTMLCWTTGPNVDGGAKWFQIASDDYPYQSGGYVPANSVGRQATVGHC
jgi:hypothetical protein